MGVATTALPVRPLFMQAQLGDPALPYTAEDFRNLIGSMNSRHGAIGPPTSFTVTQRGAGANFSLDIQPGWYIAAAADATTYDTRRWLVRLATTLNVPLQPGFTTTSPGVQRTHGVWLAVNDKSIAGSVAAYNAEIWLTEDEGSGAGAPITAAAHQLATFTTGPGQINISTANINNGSWRRAHPGATGKMAVSFNAGYASADVTAAVGPARWYMDGSRVHFDGGVRRLAGDMAAATTYTAFTLPRHAWPLHQKYLIGIAENNTHWRMTVATNGQCIVTPSALTGFVAMDGMSYDLW